MPWRLVGLAGSVAATLVMGRFESVLESRVAVAFFIPGLVYLTDPVRALTETVVIRGLSLGRASLRRLLVSEVGTGCMIGLVLAGIVLRAIAMAYGDLRLAAAVSMALVIAGIVATSIGVLFPWILRRMGRDSAFEAAPSRRSSRTSSVCSSTLLSPP